MTTENLRPFLERHLQAVFDCDLEAYHATTHPDLTLYEWYISPHRIDGIPFHDFMMTEAERGHAAPMTGMALHNTERSAVPHTHEKPRTRFDLANYREQHFGDTVVTSYTLLISQGSAHGVLVRSYNESRILVKFPEGWKVVHVHKSPAWNAPFQPPKA